MTTENEELSGENTPSPEVDPQIEKEARLAGWNPDYDGPNKKTAEEFVEEGKRINGFLKKDREKLHAALAQRDQELAEIKAAVAQFAEHHKLTEQKAYERAIKDLKEQKKQAIQSGDGELVIQLEDELDQLKQAQAQPVTPMQPVPKAAPQPSSDPVFNTWASENSWYGKDSRLTVMANALAEELRLEQPELLNRPFLDEVVRRLKEEVPHKFENPNRTKANSVASGANTSKPTKGKKTFADLPQEAKDACKLFVKKGWITEEQYIKEYFGEDND